MEAEGCTVCSEVTVQVVIQEGPELFRGDKVSTLVYVMTTCQDFVELNVVTTIQLIDHHFPNCEVTGRAALVSTQTLVRHTVHESVWPQGQATHGSRNRRVVQETPIDHHVELAVTTYSLPRHAQTKNFVGRNVGELFDNYTGAVHFALVSSGIQVAPVGAVLIVGDGTDSNFVTYAVQLLHS